jgi:hypothetical protein
MNGKAGDSRPSKSPDLVERTNLVDQGFGQKIGKMDAVIWVIIRKQREKGGIFNKEVYGH